MVSTGAGLAIAVFLAATVEFIEAFTIVLAIGVSRGWRAAVAGAVAALTVLAVVTAAVGSALARWVPETALQLVVGVLLPLGVGLLLITLGTYWAVEGIGVFVPSDTLTWLGGDLALALLAVWIAGALITVQVLRTRVVVT